VSLSAAHLGRQGQAARCDESSPRLLKTRRDETIDNHLLLPLAWTARATHALTSMVVPSPGQAGRNPTQPDQTGPRRGGGRTHRIGEQQPAGPCSLLPAACLFSSATLIVTAAATTAAGYGGIDQATATAAATGIGTGTGMGIGIGLVACNRGVSGAKGRGELSSWL
jgi:hypothetical protein